MRLTAEQFSKSPEMVQKHENSFKSVEKETPKPPSNEKKVSGSQQMDSVNDRLDSEQNMMENMNGEIQPERVSEEYDEEEEGWEEE